MNKDALFWNKIAGAVLTAALLAMVTGEIAGALYGGGGEHGAIDEQAFVIATGETQTAAATEEPAEPAGPEPIAPLLASADPAAGEKATRKCASCHSFEKGGPNKVGPNLYDVVGRALGAVGDYNYSGAMADHGGEWTYANLNEFLYDPKGFVSGTKMSFGGIKDTQDRADLIAYLRSMGDNPPPLPGE